MPFLALKTGRGLNTNLAFRRVGRPPLMSVKKLDKPCRTSLVQKISLETGITLDSIMDNMLNKGSSKRSVKLLEMLVKEVKGSF